MKRILFILLLILILVHSTVYAAGFTAEPEVFRNRFEQKVVLPGGQPFFQLELAPSLFANMDASLKDLRLYAGGKELGYIGLPVHEEQRQVKALTILNQGMESSGMYSFELQYPHGASTGKNQALQIYLATNPYFVKGELFGGTDGRTWKKLKDITLFSIQEQTNEVPLEGIQYPYLKIAFRPPNEPPAGSTMVSKAQLIATTPIGATISSPEKMDFTSSLGEGKGEVYLVADLKYQNRLTDQLIVQTEETAFYRQVTLEGSADGKKWVPILSTYIYRGTGAGDEKLSIPYSARYDRYLRLKIENADNPALQVKGLECRVYPQRILVKAPPNTTSFTLQGYFGNARIQSPSYDVGNVLKETGWRDFPVIQVQEYGKNPLYDPNKAIPFTERYPYLLTIVLILAATVVFAVLYRTIKEVKK